MLFITALELQNWIHSDKSFELLDVREKFEYQQGNIGGKNIPMGEIPQKWLQQDIVGKAVIVCRSGKRAEAVANMLERDFKANEMYVLEGGLLTWKNAVDNQLELD